MIDVKSLVERLASAARRWQAGAKVDDVSPIGRGSSSLTYLASLTGVPQQYRSVVVKVAPPGLEPVRNRDVLRQFRLLTSLHGVSGVLVPEALFDDRGDPPDVPPLFAMSRVEGECFEPNLDQADTLPPPDMIQGRALHAARVLAALHSVDPDAIGVADEPVVDPRAEVERWIRAFDSVPADLRDGAAESGTLLLESAAVPVPSTVIHGDYRLGNMLCVGDKVRAVIDWEIWGRGDPRLDLCWFLVTGDSKRYRPAVRIAPGMPGPEKLLEAYEGARGASMGDLRWHHALVQFKMAATGALLIKHNRRRENPDPGRERRAPDIPVMLAQVRELLHSR